jgi:C-methyltransferase C-terminal domain/Putative zinc binding domain
VGHCLVCGSDRVEKLLELGPQPVSSHFTKTRDAAVIERDLTFALCPVCGVMQLAKPFPFRDLVRPYDWITYREPEMHLDAVVERICSLPGLNQNTAVAGITFKDKTTLERLRARGFSKIWSLDARDDLGATDANADIESVQALLTPAKAAEIVERRGHVDLLVVRHIAEHTEAPAQFMAALATFLAPNGYMIIEVPDCGANLARQDYTMIWEEHALYLTRQTASQILAPAACALVDLEIHPFAFEDVIVLYAQKSEAAAAQSSAESSAIERSNAVARRFAESFPVWTARYGRLFDRLTEDGRGLAAYGAGHLTCAFLNFHGLAHYFAAVIDDTPHKQGLFLPKARLPIVPRSALSTRQVSACLFGLAPELEDKVVANAAEYAAGGGKFYSMFVDSPRSIRTLLHEER